MEPKKPKSKRGKLHSWFKYAGIPLCIAVSYYVILPLFYRDTSSLESYRNTEPPVSKSDQIAPQDDVALSFDGPPTTALPPYSSIVDFLESKSTINTFNRNKLLPLLKSLASIDYFRYIKLNLNRPCTLWCDAGKCNLRDCKVKSISDPKKCPVDYDDELSTVNTDLAKDQLDLLIKLFECNDNEDHDSQYVDLLVNPERFTGYSGETAHRIWRAIYEENCFVSKSHSPFSQDLCYEERLFYEAISGLHSSINIHLCAEYPSHSLIGEFKPNLDEFLRRFDGHIDYLENLYRLFLLELRALTKSKPQLMKRVINVPDQATKSAVQNLFTVVEKLDTPIFKDLSLKPSHVSHELAIHFRNITTTIIDCVACDKCKLWGKVQLRGLGTAFKILSVKDITKLHLNHQEVISLINAITRLSHSIRQLETFRDLMLSNNYHHRKHDNLNKNNNMLINS